LVTAALIIVLGLFADWPLLPLVQRIAVLGGP
jgi:hypothetical protein